METTAEFKLKYSESLGQDSELAKLLLEEELEPNELSKDLKDRLHALGMSIAKYKKNPTENLKAGIVKADIALSSDTDKWIDEQVALFEQKKAKELAEQKKKETPPEPIVAPTPVVEKVETPPEPTPAEIEAKKKADAEAEAEKAKNESSAKVAKMESDIKEKINAHPEKRISTADLASIIGRQPSHPDRCGSLGLRKIFPLQFWRIE